MYSMLGADVIEHQLTPTFANWTTIEISRLLVFSPQDAEDVREKDSRECSRLDRRDTLRPQFCIALQCENKILISIFAAADVNYVSTIIFTKATDLCERK